MNVGHLSNITDILKVVSTHSGAAPLDYILTCLTIHIVGNSELALRFLPLCWSIITVALIYAVAQVINPHTGKWAALIATISPLAIRYAQEVRFYSLGLMLGTATLTLAVLLAKGRLKLTPGTWLVVLLLAAGTAYAHVYSTLLCAAGLALIYTLSPSQVRARRLIWFTSALVCAALSFLPWLLGAMNTRPHPMGTSTLGATELSSILSGLELSPVLPNTNLLASLYIYCLIVFHLFAIFACLRRSPVQRLLINLIAVYIVCAGIVIILTLRTHYFFHPRQFLFLLPIRALFLGLSLALAEKAIAQNVRLHAIGIALASGLVGLLIVSAAFTVKDDLNRLERSNAKAIATAIMQTGGLTNRSAWMVPAWSAVTIDYYLADQNAAPTHWNKYGTTDEMVQILSNSSAPTFIVVDSLRSPLETQLEKIGFRLVPVDAEGVYSLLIR